MFYSLWFVYLSEYLIVVDIPVFVAGLSIRVPQSYLFVCQKTFVLDVL